MRQNDPNRSHYRNRGVAALLMASIAVAGSIVGSKAASADASGSKPKVIYAPEVFGGPEVKLATNQDVQVYADELAKKILGMGFPFREAHDSDGTFYRSATNRIENADGSFERFNATIGYVEENGEMRVRLATITRNAYEKGEIESYSNGEDGSSHVLTVGWAPEPFWTIMSKVQGIEGFIFHSNNLEYGHEDPITEEFLEQEGQFAHFLIDRMQGITELPATR